MDETTARDITARRETAPARRRPATILRAEALPRPQVLNARPIARAKPLGRLARFRDWRSTHYAADQALRVVTILLVAAGLLAGVLAVLIALGAWLFSVTAPALPAVLGVAGVVLLIAALLRGGSSEQHGKRGYGWHWTKCK